MTEETDKKRPVIECRDCGDRENDVRFIRVHEDRGWGAGFKGWTEKFQLCKRCRIKWHGEFKYAK